MRTLLALTLMLACGGALGGDDRGVTVFGQAAVEVVPDQAVLVVGVSELGSDVAAAQAATDRVVEAFLSRARRLGAGDPDLQAPGTRIQAEYEWLQKERRRQLVGYRAHRQVQVRIRDLERLGAFISAASQAGMNEQSPPVLVHSREAALRIDALEAAAKDARTQAAALAASLGAKLGRVRAIEVVGGHEPPAPKMLMMQARAEVADAAPVSLGEIRIEARVRVRFTLD